MIAYLFIDIDDFGDINKKFGFGYGNKVLKRFKSHVKNHFSKDGTVFHFGADSFLVEFKGAFGHEDLMKKVGQFLNHPIVFHVNHHPPIKLTSSIGISVEKEHGSEFWELVRCADVALRDAKMNGKNTVKIYEQKTDDICKLRFELKQNLIRSIENEEFEMVYQPIMSTDDEEIVGFEALVRWQHKSKDKISTYEMVEMTEQIGHMPDLETWIVSEVFKHAKEIFKYLKNIKFMSINLSPKGLDNLKLIQLLKHLQNQYQIDPHKIIFERTEGYLIQDFEQSILDMEELGRLGYRFALDDFGTGYSSLSYMSKLPIAKLKIDRSFIRHIETNERDRLMTKSIIELAHNLDLKVVVEGVERKSQADLLKDMGCDYFQGYLYSKPISFDAILKL